MTFYEKILTSFNDNNVEYLIVGGIAVTLYGADRTTKDLDIWVKTSNENIEHLRISFFKLGFSESNIKEALTRILSGETIIIPDTEENLFKVDILGLFSSFIDFETAYNQKTEMKLGSINASIISLGQLIESKIHAGRDKDLLDVKNLKELQNKLNNKNNANTSF
jgi:predicted nucleotidyltransferase